MAESLTSKVKLPSTDYEAALHAQGFSIVAGVDEAGRGPLAGPVVAAAVVLPDDLPREGINDSKVLSPRKREELFLTILEEADVGIGCEDVETIDRINILRATCQAMRRAVAQLDSPPDYVLIDGRPIGKMDFRYTPIVRGDRVSLSVAAASIVAKVTRDRIMLALDQQYPEYGFARHKGYATGVHLRQLARHGPCPVHRRSFAPVRLVCGNTPREEGQVLRTKAQLSLKMESS